MGEPVRWTSHPARRRPLVAALTLGLVASFALLASHAAFGGSPVATVILAFALVGSIARFYLPVRYELGDDGVSFRMLGVARDLPWQRVRALEVGRGAARLFTRSRRGWLARLGSVLVPLEEAPEAARTILEERKASLDRRPAVGPREEAA